jgi:hypothetical protein
MVGWLMNDVLGRIWNDAEARCCLQFLEELREITENRIGGVAAEIRTEQCMNTGIERYM